MSALKPCPFCHSFGSSFFHNPSSAKNHSALAIAAWNTRAEPKPRALTLEELRGMDSERVWVQFPTICMYGLVSYLTGEEYSDDEEFERVYITNSLGGRNSYDEINEQGGIIYSPQPKSLTPEQFESICESVHNGWWEEKVAQGDTSHPDMIPYADLAENVREYDRVTVRRVLDALGVLYECQSEGE